MAQRALDNDDDFLILFGAFLCKDSTMCAAMVKQGEYDDDSIGAIMLAGSSRKQNEARRGAEIGTAAVTIAAASGGAAAITAT